jgi:hypothetical protein
MGKSVMTIENLQLKIEREVEDLRDRLNSALGEISDIADKPLADNQPNMESAVIIRLRELMTIVNLMHSRLNQIRALKIVLRQIKKG